MLQLVTRKITLQGFMISLINRNADPHICPYLDYLQGA